MNEKQEFGLRELRRHLEKLEKDHYFVTNEIIKNYSEINKGELLIASGAFVVLINYLAFFENRTIEYKLLLIVGVLLLLISILYRFHIARNISLRMEKEKNLINKKISIVSELYSLVTSYDVAQEAPPPRFSELMKDLERVEANFRSLSNGYSFGKFYNEVEYIMFFVGISCVFMFFWINL